VIAFSRRLSLLSSARHNPCVFRHAQRQSFACSPNLPRSEAPEK